MKVTFGDHQDSGNPLNGAQIESSVALASTLESLRTRAPFLCEIVGENGFKLLLGVGADHGCVQHSPADGSTPYLMAVADPTGSLEEHLEFLAGDTATPVAKRYCLSFERVKEIATHFLEYGERLGTVMWEEI